MTKTKKLKPLVIIILVVIIVLSPIIVIFALNMFAWSSIFIGGWLSPNPPEPEITYAEFPFEIVYEIDGKTVTVNDAYVCEFDGFGWNEGVGKHREWKGYIKSSGAKELVLLEDGDLKFAVSVGFPEYYMSDQSVTQIKELTPSIYYIKPNEYGGVSSGIIDIEPLLEQYKLKLTSFKFSEPIENSFE